MARGKRWAGSFLATGIVVGMAVCILPLPLWTAYATPSPTSAPTSAASPPPQARLEALQRDLGATREQKAELEEKAATLDKNVSSLRQRLLESAAEVDASTARLDAIEADLQKAEEEAARRTATLTAQRATLARTLARLQNLARVPPAVLLLAPTPPLDRIHADMQMKALLPLLRQQGAEVAALVDEIRRARALLVARQSAAQRESLSLATRQRQLTQLVDLRTRQLNATQQQRAAEATRLAKLSDEASSLQDLVERLAREREAAASAAAAASIEDTARANAEKAGLPSPPASNTRMAGIAEAALGPPPRPRALPPSASRRLPVTGTALVRFGEPDSLGNVSRGLTLSPRAGAPVTAVAAGRVAFAGPFRGYGRILIVEHAAGYHTVVAGLATVSVAVGQRVAAGEPLGLMGTETSPPPQLYFEVRHSGSPVDPLGAGAAGLTASPGPAKR